MFSFQELSFVCPGAAIVIVPPYPHVSWQLCVRTGLPPIITFDFSDVHGPEIIGMHVDGVRTPSAAEVAAATAGLLMLVHAGNGAMFVPG